MDTLFSGKWTESLVETHKIKTVAVKNIAQEPSRARHLQQSLLLMIFFVLFWSTCLLWFYRHLTDRSGNKSIAFWNEFSLWKDFFVHFLDLNTLSTDLGPRPSDNGVYLYIYLYHVEMCSQTLRRMVNINVFYKKVYNHLDIYTNTQIYIHIYVYSIYIMAIEKVITSVIIQE